MATSRTRVISQSKAVFVGPTGLPTADTGYIPDQLHRIDTFSFDIDIAGARQDIREFGQLARIASVTMSDINPSLSFGYYLLNGENEARLGFNDDGIDGTGPLSQFVSGIISEDRDKKVKNIYVLTTKEGQDAFNTGQLILPAVRVLSDVVSFGNVTLNSYTASFAVGDIPRVDIEAEASNITFTTGTYSGFNNPSINQAGEAQAGTVAVAAMGGVGGAFVGPSTGDATFPVLKPDDITLTFTNPSFEMGGTNFSDMHVQSATVEVPLSRSNIEALGSARPVAKPLDFPIDVTFSFSSLLKSFDDGTLDLVLTGTAGDETTDITLAIADEEKAHVNIFKLVGAQLDSQSFSQGLDDNETVDLTFSAQIGAPDTTNQGIFYSGLFDGVVDATGIPANSYTLP
tara:strand:- start:1451 stop:2653 length:1203 start_codon:yes stop_codon:yes gene_type:complete